MQICENLYVREDMAKQNNSFNRSYKELTEYIDIQTIN